MCETQLRASLLGAVGPVRTAEDPSRIEASG
jgi:hypothetical protein